MERDETFCSPIHYAFGTHSPVKPSQTRSTALATALATAPRPNAFWITLWTILYRICLKWFEAFHGLIITEFWASNLLVCVSKLSSLCFQDSNKKFYHTIVSDHFKYHKGVFSRNYREIISLLSRAFRVIIMWPVRWILPSSFPVAGMVLSAFVWCVIKCQSVGQAFCSSW